MYYTVRPAGPKTKKEQLQFFLLLFGQVFKIFSGLCIIFFSFMAGITGNFGALACLFIVFLFCGIGFNLFSMQTWLPGWRNGTWFSRTVILTIYLFTALAILLVSNPVPM